MNKIALTAFLLALTISSSAQVVVEKKVSTDPVTGEQTVTLDTYRTKIRENYATIGVPTEVIDKVVPLDVDIYNARLAGDTVRVRTLRHQQEVLLTPTYTTKVRTYYQTNPYKVNIGSTLFPVWVDENVAVAPSPTDVQVIEVPTYEQKLRASYVSVGIPENIIEQILPLDVDIYNAYATGNVAAVVDLQERRMRIVPPGYVPKLRTYFSTNPFKVTTTGNHMFTVWEAPDGQVREVQQVRTVEKP